MPELPEVESLRRGLDQYLAGSRIQKVEVSLAKIVSGKGTKRVENQETREQFVTGIAGRTIVEIYRRAKNLIFVFDDQSFMLVHLKMTGQLVFRANNKDLEEISGGHPIQNLELPNKHTHIIFSLDNGTLYYNDLRQFGYVLYARDKAQLDALESFTALGLEPMSEDFTLDLFHQNLKRFAKSRLKKIFLDQKVVVGLGNIYSDEVCFFAGVRPDRKVGTLTDAEIEKLFEAIKVIIPKAVDLGGSSVSQYLLADGSRGNYAREHMVYLKGGKPCKVCGATLEKIKFAGRTTVYCPVCQQ